MNYQLLCKTCHTPTRLTKTLAYMRCMCDEDVRIIPLLKEDDIKLLFIPDNLYLLKTEGNNYVTMENTKTF
jgi:hypothetical protein